MGSTSRIRVALFKGLGGKLKKLWNLFRKAPQLWEQVKEFLGIEGLRDAPRKISEWAKKGMDALKKGFQKVLVNNPLVAMYFIPKHRLPNLTDMLARITMTTPRIGRMLQKVNTKWVQPLDEWLKKHPILRGLARPVLAAIFIWIWLHVAEVSWDLPGLVRGFTGGISVGELLSSLPESGIGLVVALLFPGLGTFALLPVTIMARLTFLLYKKIIKWAKGKGFIIDWERLAAMGEGEGGEVGGTGTELVPVM